MSQAGWVVFVSDSGQREGCGRGAGDDAVSNRGVCWLGDRQSMLVYMSSVQWQPLA